MQTKVKLKLKEDSYQAKDLSFCAAEFREYFELEGVKSCELIIDTKKPKDQDYYAIECPSRGFDNYWGFVASELDAFCSPWVYGVDEYLMRRYLKKPRLYVWVIA